MSLNITTVSDKAEFTNYFTEAITLPKNCEAVLTKANLGIPIQLSPHVRVPDVAAYDEVACWVQIDGVRKAITWQKIFNAHVAYFMDGTSVDRIIAGQEAAYFGYYTFLPNDAVLVNCASDAASTAGAGGPVIERTKVSFNQVLARAIDVEFDFYRVQSSTVFKDKNGEVLYDLTLQAYRTITTPLIDGAGANIVGSIEAMSNDNINEFGFNVSYDPANVSKSTATDINWSAADSLINFTRTASNQITSSNAGVNVAMANTHASGFSIDPNGGWVGTIITYAGGSCAWGLNFVGTGDGDSPDPNFLGGGGTTINDYINLIDVGFLYTTNAGGQQCFQVIDGHTTDAAYDGANVINPALSILKPPHPIHQFLDGDKFFIQIIRGNEFLDGTSEFKITLYSGTAAVLDDGDDVLYQCTLKAPGEFNPTLIVLSDNVVGNDFNQWKIIEKSVESAEQTSYLTSDNDGPSFMGTMSIEPRYGNGGLVVDEIFNFWKTWGFNSLRNATSELNATTDDSDPLSTYFLRTKGTSLFRQYHIDTQLQDADVNYIIGVKKANQIWANALVGETEFYLNEGILLNSLPPQLLVSLDNLDIKNFEGALIGNQTSGTTLGVRQPTNRNIGSIPLPLGDIDETGNYVIQYEPFNIIYRPVNNPVPMPINQLVIRIYYIDFNTNQHRVIKELYGLAALEFTIRQGYNPPKKLVNGLLPY